MHAGIYCGRVIFIIAKGRDIPAAVVQGTVAECQIGIKTLVFGT